jgi:hypothetical protein
LYQTKRRNVKLHGKTTNTAELPDAINTCAFAHKKVKYGEIEDVDQFNHIKSIIGLRKLK